MKLLHSKTIYQVNDQEYLTRNNLGEKHPAQFPSQTSIINGEKISSVLNDLCGCVKCLHQKTIWFAVLTWLKRRVKATTFGALVNFSFVVQAQLVNS